MEVAAGDSRVIRQHGQHRGRARALLRADEPLLSHKTYESNGFSKVNSPTLFLV